MLDIRAGIHKMHARIAIREDPDQTSGLHDKEKLYVNAA